MGLYWIRLSNGLIVSKQGSPDTFQKTGKKLNGINKALSNFFGFAEEMPLAA